MASCYTPLRETFGVHQNSGVNSAAIGLNAQIKMFANAVLQCITTHLQIFVEPFLQLRKLGHSFKFCGNTLLESEWSETDRNKCTRFESFTQGFLQVLNWKTWKPLLSAYLSWNSHSTSLTSSKEMLPSSDSSVSLVFCTAPLDNPFNSFTLPARDRYKCEAKSSH